MTAEEGLKATRKIMAGQLLRVKVVWWSTKPRDIGDVPRDVRLEFMLHRKQLQDSKHQSELADVRLCQSPQLVGVRVSDSTPMRPNMATVQHLVSPLGILPANHTKPGQISVIALAEIWEGEVAVLQRQGNGMVELLS